MPELPEVETIRLQLTKLISGLKIKKITVFQKKSFNGDERLLSGATITDLRRFGKMLVIDTDRRIFLAVHLKMTGQLLFKNMEKNYSGLPDKYTRVVIEFSDKSCLFFNDIRRFGWMKTITEEDLQKMVSKFGPDPLKITKKEFYEILAKSGKPLKLFIMDQEKLAGVGNIYANEALFEAKIHPQMKSAKLSRQKAELLLEKLKNVLQKGVKFGGASPNAYLNAYGEKGEMQEHVLVYGREGEKCLQGCGGKIKRIVMGGRGTFFCPNCQK